MFLIAGIVPSDIYCGVKADWERTKQKYDKLHPNVQNKLIYRTPEIKEEFP